MTIQIQALLSFGFRVARVVARVENYKFQRDAAETCETPSGPGSEGRGARLGARSEGDQRFSSEVTEHEEDTLKGSKRQRCAGFLVAGALLWPGSLCFCHYISDLRVLLSSDNRTGLISPPIADVLPHRMSSSFKIRTLAPHPNRRVPTAARPPPRPPDQCRAQFFTIFHEPNRSPSSRIPVVLFYIPARTPSAEARGGPIVRDGPAGRFGLVPMRFTSRNNGANNKNAPPRTFRLVGGDTHFHTMQCRVSRCP